MTEKYFHSRPEEGTLRLFLVRHGETEANRNRYLQGVSNGFLNETGKLQVEKLGKHLANIYLDRVLASDLQRAIDTANAVAQPHGLGVKTDSELREWNVGELDGQPATLYRQMIKELGKPLSQFDPPGGQKLGEVRRRADALVKKLITDHLGEAVLVTSHGDFMRQVVGSILGIDEDTAMAFHFSNASYSVFEYKDENWKIIALNRVAMDCD